MRCNQCQHTETKVVESRDASEGDSTRRRRECIDCKHRFTTYERIENPQLVIVKNGGTRQLYSREKLLAGLYRACEKTSVSALQVEKVVNDIEKKLYASGDTEIPSARLGEFVMEELAEVSEVAYVRFASVYRRFKDIASFEKELSDIKNHLQTNATTLNTP